MKQIHLTRGQIAIVDDADFEWLNQWKWQASVSNGGWYARRSDPSNGDKKIYMHREIMSDPDGQVDHVNCDGLDNRRFNLRLAKRFQNQANQKSSGGASKYKGVSYCRDTGRWSALICANGIRGRIGRFDTDVQAALAYDQQARLLHGSFARLNFPNIGEQHAVA